MILIISADDDPHADQVEARLRQRGASVERFDGGDYPARAQISVRYAGGRPQRTITARGRTLDLERVRALWHRRPGVPAPEPIVHDPATRAYTIAECKKHLVDLWASLPCAQVPGTQAVYGRAELKAMQLEVAAKLGFEVPPTLFTNDPRALLDFHRQHDGQIVSKLASAAFFASALSDYFVRYTELSTTRDVGYARGIRHCPMIFQAYVEKRLELRVTVVGERVFAAEIHSQETEHTRHDWRRYDHATTPHAVHVLPPSVEDQCRALVTELGLVYGAIDLILTPDGRYVFLEINPNGQYLWIENRTGLPISDAIADLLMSRRTS
jgi:hypothetical protein